ncbi:GNAT family N-acetyltransferase [Roseovarius aestuariivivens]|uniref:GNAT family N-acetyltransferase n=1 Tax=Roseovarius aestuariivivens TaxID=1888910 RepID=UPI0010800034|nr:GNAT family N-acetyltransferase [Roseovarius aestuariivivens]
MRIRLYQPEDAAALSRILHDAVHGLGMRDYTPAQLAAWSPTPQPPAQFAARLGDGRAVFVAEDAALAPCAFIELLPSGQIDRFYCAPGHAGIGVAAALYDHLETEARRRGLDRLTVDASAMARRFFLRQGFTELARQEVERAGVTLYNFAMAKDLSQPADNGP